MPDIDISKDIHSLSDFKRNTTEFVSQMRESGHPVVLTINGKAELVVQDAEAYQRLLDMLERAEAVDGIKKGLESMKHAKGRSADQVSPVLRSAPGPL